MDTVWANNLKIKLLHTDLEMEVDACTSFWRHPEYLPTAGSDAKQLTRILQALCRDEIGMEKYRRAIGAIGVKSDGSRGVSGR
jgi:hypothetical protein